MAGQRDPQLESGCQAALAKRQEEKPSVARCGKLLPGSACACRGLASRALADCKLAVRFLLARAGVLCLLAFDMAAGSQCYCRDQCSAAILAALGQARCLKTPLVFVSWTHSLRSV